MTTPKFDFSSPELPFEKFDFQTLCILSTLSKTINERASNVIQGMEVGTQLLEYLVINKSKQKKILRTFSQRNFDNIIYTLHTNFGDNICLLGTNQLSLNITAKFGMVGANYTVDKRYNTQLVPDVSANSSELLERIKGLVLEHTDNFLDMVCPDGVYDTVVYWTLRKCQVFELNYGYSFKTFSFDLNTNDTNIPPLVYNSQSSFILEFINRFYVVV